MTKPTVKRKVDLFVVLEGLDRRNMKLYDEIAVDAEARKELDREIGYMLPIWMTGAARNDDHMALIDRFNACCNLHWFKLYGNPRMQLRLLAHIGLGRKVAHRFNKVKAAPRSTALFDLLSLTHPDIRGQEVRIWVSKNTVEDVEELARGHGWTDEQVEKVLKNYKEMRT